MTPFDLERLRRATFLRHIEYIEETASTNTLAAALADQNDHPLPLLVLTARQTAGRGRGANRWWSSEGALTFSLVLDAAGEQLSPTRRPLISLAAGLAVCEALHELLPEGHFGVKWPNDVHLDGRKVCGILVESAARGERLVIGVGMNVNNPTSEAPEEIAARAASLRDAAGCFFNFTDVLARTLRHLECQWRTLLAGDSVLIDNLRSRCVLTGRTVTIVAGSQRHTGLCRGIAGDGALTIETAGGRSRIYAGVVEYIDV
ncbi:MAG: biotin--[acetyl-CoA-carboxylase] ligase [Planctomycetes bacterium]|nr:biotin--[acetyl-CoA-carboxylase] ligase [Planctomycetota bacterium]